jgi:uncharacterized membrane-anchored protein
MTAFVEECRREWKRLGVPDLLAEEMATELEADLVEAEADGLSVAELLGESDPRRFAATWASERGLVAEAPPEQKRRKRFWIGLAVGLVVVGFLLGIGGVVLFAKPKVSAFAGIKVNIHTVPAPNFVGVYTCVARTIARHMRLPIRTIPNAALHAHRCNTIVVSQTPEPGMFVRRAVPPIHLSGPVVTLRVRRR